MQLSTRQERLFRLAILLGSGLPVSGNTIISRLSCSEATLTRALKEVRKTYSAEIKYSKAMHAYQLIAPGQLDKKVLRRMNVALISSDVLKSEDPLRPVSLNKEQKKTASLSLRRSVLRRIDQIIDLPL